jgi:hypothetical protein
MFFLIVQVLILFSWVLQVPTVPVMIFFIFLVPEIYFLRNKSENEDKGSLSREFVVIN